MDALPIRPAPPHRHYHPRAAHAARPASARTAATHPTAHSAAAHAPPSADDLALIAQQAQFDMLMQSRAEAEREANALRDLAMEQLKHDDSAMHAWIKMI